jgi:predicted transcriptional regulator
MIKDRYDLLKYLVAFMSSKTRRFKDPEHKLTQMIGPHKLSEYLTDLKNEGLINVYIGSEIEILDAGIDFAIQLNNG